MTLAVEKDVSSDPAELGIFRTQAVVLHVQALTHLVEQLGRRVRHSGRLVRQVLLVIMGRIEDQKTRPANNLANSLF